MRQRGVSVTRPWGSDPAWAAGTIRAASVDQKSVSSVQCTVYSFWLQKEPIKCKRRVYVSLSVSHSGVIISD